MSTAAARQKRAPGLFREPKVSGGSKPPFHFGLFQGEIGIGGRRRPRPPARVQPCARPALKVLDLLAERRRPDPCLGAAPREVTLLRDRQETMDMERGDFVIFKNDEQRLLYILEVSSGRVHLGLEGPPTPNS